ncbi:hypothetical protein BGZ50_003790 [Haplosporangium sp. Z 11]|nr:hypothetical protein BGZ50_003790 [Haplosporangium sp. Z 11]
MTTAENPSQSPPVNADGRTPHVMIVGAGLAGLLLGILLDRASIPYQIYERSKTIRPLGAVMSLSPNVMPVFEQLGLFEDLENISLPSRKFNIMTGRLETLGSFQSDNVQQEAIGYDSCVFARPQLYELLLSKIPSENIHFGKKILSLEQNHSGVMIRCNDGTTYHGDILVGADGAYSGVRQGLYKSLQNSGRLPESDAQEMNKGFVCMVGTTVPLDPAEYPGVDKDVSQAYQIIGEGTPYCWSSISVPGNRICWNAIKQLANVKQAEDYAIRNSEWGPDSNEEMIHEVKDFPIPDGHTLGDLISATPKETVSRVFLEDKLFETWHHGRTVLIGDAAHKLLPSVGQGAVTAMQDAVILANCLYDLKSTSHEDIEAALQDYQGQRYPHVKEQYEGSKMNAKVIYGQTLLERFTRHVVLNYLPRSHPGDIKRSRK